MKEYAGQIKAKLGVARASILSQVLWLFLFAIILIFAHLTNPNNQLISNWLPDSQRIVSGDLPASNWYGPTAAILMIPFIHVSNVFLATLVYGLLGAYFYWRLTEAIPSTAARIVARALVIINVYLFRLIDSSGDTVFEFFLLNLFCFAIYKNRFLVFTASGFFLGELRSAYWLVYLGVSAFLFFSSKGSIRPRLKYLIVIPALFMVLVFNASNYGNFSTAGEGGYTAFFTNNKSSYMTGNSFMVDNFSFGEGGPMNRRCADLNPCSDHQLFMKTIEENIQNPQAFGFNLLQKTAIYFFEPQKVPRIPGEFYLHESENYIEIGKQRLTSGNLLASVSYFGYRAIILITFWFLFLYLLISSKRNRRRMFRDNKLAFMSLPWIFGSVPGVLFVAETRLWIVMEVMLIPCLSYFLFIIYQDHRNRDLVE